MFKYLLTSLRMLFALALLTGLIYPFVITGIAQIIFPQKANGSPVMQNGKIIGSECVGQYFNDPKYFWGRPSATFPVYNASASSGSNLGPSSKTLTEIVGRRIKILHEADPENTLVIPADLVTASGSGLDPHISIEAATYQIHRIAPLRKISEKKLSELVQRFTEAREFEIWGQPRVHVLKLNRALDHLQINPDQ